MAQQQPVNYWINPSQRFSPEGAKLNVNSDSNHNSEVEPSQADEENGSPSQLERESSLLSDNDFYSMVESSSTSRPSPSVPELSTPRTPSPSSYSPASPLTPRSAYKTPPTRRGHVNINESYNTTSYYSPLKYTPDPSKPVHFRPLMYAIDQKSGDGPGRAEGLKRDHGIPLRSVLKKRAQKREEGGIQERRALRPKNLNIKVEPASKLKESAARVVIDIPASPEPATSLSMEDVTSSIERAAKIIKENNRRLVKWRDEHALRIENAPPSSLDEISDLHKTIETLQKEAAVMQQITAVQEKSLKGLKAQTCTLDEIRLELEREVAAKDGTIASMQAMLAEYQDQIANLEETANRRHEGLMKDKERIGEVALLERQLCAEQTRTEELQNQLRNAHGEGSKLVGEERKKRGEFERKMMDLETAVKNREEEILRLREKEASEKARNSELRSELVLANMEIERLKGTSSLSEEKSSETISPNTFTKASELNMVVLELQRMLTKKNEEIDRLVKEMMRNVGRLQDRGPVTQDMRQKLVSANKRIAELESALLEKSTEISKLTSELKSAQDAVSKKKELPRSHAQISSYLEDVEKYKKLWQEQESLAKEREETLTQVKTALETMKKSSITKEEETLLNQLIEAHEYQIRELTQSLEIAQNRVHQLEAEVKEKDAVASDLKTTEEAARNELATHKEIMKKRDERIYELEDDIKRFRSGTMEGSPTKFKGMYKLYEDRIHGLEEQLHIAQERLLAVQGTTRHKDAELLKLSKAIDDKERRIQSLLESVERLNKEKSQTYDHITKKYEHRIASLRKSSEAKKIQIMEQEDLIARCHEHIEILSEQLAEQRVQLAEKDVKVVKYYKLLKTYKDTREALQRSLSDKDKELDTTITTPPLRPSSTSRGSITRPAMAETALRTRKNLPIQSEGRRSALGIANTFPEDRNDLRGHSNPPAKGFTNSGISVAV